MCGMKGSTVTKRDPNTFIKIALPNTVATELHYIV
jgi:hypothetical protein